MGVRRPAQLVPAFRKGSFSLELGFSECAQALGSPGPFYKKQNKKNTFLAVTFISLGRGVIYSSDPGAREPSPWGSGGGRQRGQRHSSDGPGGEARNRGWGCSVSWEPQKGKGARREQLVPTGGHRGSLWPSSWGRWAGRAGVLAPGTSCGKRLVSLGGMGA